MKLLAVNGRRFARETFSPETFGGRAHRELARLKGAPAAPFPNLLLPFLRRAMEEIEARSEAEKGQGKTASV